MSFPQCLFANKDFKIYEDRFEFKQIKSNMSDVKNIDIEVNDTHLRFISFRSFLVSIHIRGLKKTIKKQAFSLSSNHELITIFELISKYSFPYRINKYLHQMEKTGGFHYRGANFYSNGEVYYRGTIFNLDESEFNIREIKLQKKSWFAPLTVIKLINDRDVILTLLDHILKNPLPPESYISNTKRSKNDKGFTKIFINDIVSLMAKISKADGQVTRDELVIVKKFLSQTLKLSEIELKQAFSIFNYAKDSPTSYEMHAEKLKQVFKDQPEMLIATLELLFNISLADGDFSVEELFIFEGVKRIFDVQLDSYERFKSRSKNRTHSGSKDRGYYLGILGLGKSATYSEVKKQYKRLVLKFHPDLVHHMGPEATKEAEEKIKMVNEAYEYLK